MQKLIKRLSLAIYLGSMLFLIGCAPAKIILFPLKDKDIYDGKNEGDVCFSQFYLNEVMNVKINKHP